MRGQATNETSRGRGREGGRIAAHRIASHLHGMAWHDGLHVSSGLPIQATWMPNSAQLPLCSPITYINHAILRGQWQPVRAQNHAMQGTRRMLNEVKCSSLHNNPPTTSSDLHVLVVLALISHPTCLQPFLHTPPSF